MLFVGGDGAEDHHDVEVPEETGRRLARACLLEGVAGVGRGHELIGQCGAEDAEPEQVAIGIETDRGPWVPALIAAGYLVDAVNPGQGARSRERHSSSGAQSDTGDAHMLADRVRTDPHPWRVVAGDSEQGQALKVVARAHQSLIWDRHRPLLRLPTALGEFCPAARQAFDALTAPEVRELLAKASDPASAARVSRSQIGGALRRARRRTGKDQAATPQGALRTEHLSQPPAVSAAYAATVRPLVAVIGALNTPDHHQGRTGEGVL